jgi:hypothetical protein
MSCFYYTQTDLLCEKQTSLIIENHINLGIDLQTHIQKQDFDYSDSSFYLPFYQILVFVI